MVRCPNGHVDVAPLDYYYDDDWGYKGNKVWFKGCEARLHVCLVCRTVFIDDIKKVVTEE
jgi:hypothetical protein